MNCQYFWQVCIKQKAPEPAGRRVTRHHSKPHSWRAEKNFRDFLQCLQSSAFKAIPMENPLCRVDFHTKARSHSGPSTLVQLWFCVAKLRTHSPDSMIASDRELQKTQECLCDCSIHIHLVSPYPIQPYLPATFNVSLLKPSPKISWNDH